MGASSSTARRTNENNESNETDEPAPSLPWARRGYHPRSPEVDSLFPAQPPQPVTFQSLFPGPPSKGQCVPGKRRLRFYPTVHFREIPGKWDLDARERAAVWWSAADMRSFVREELLRRRYAHAMEKRRRKLAWSRAEQAAAARAQGTGGQCGAGRGGAHTAVAATAARAKGSGANAAASSGRAAAAALSPLPPCPRACAGDWCGDPNCGDDDFAGTCTPCPGGGGGGAAHDSPTAAGCAANTAANALPPQEDDEADDAAVASASAVSSAAQAQHIEVAHPPVCGTGAPEAVEAVARAAPDGDLPPMGVVASVRAGHGLLPPGSPSGPGGAWAGPLPEPRGGGYGGGYGRRQALAASAAAASAAAREHVAAQQQQQDKGGTGGPAVPLKRVFTPASTAASSPAKPFFWPMAAGPLMGSDGCPRRTVVGAAAGAGRDCGSGGGSGIGGGRGHGAVLGPEDLMGDVCAALARLARERESPSAGCSEVGAAARVDPSASGGLGGCRCAAAGGAFGDCPCGSGCGGLASPPPARDALGAPHTSGGGGDDDEEEEDHCLWPLETAATTFYSPVPSPQRGGGGGSGDGSPDSRSPGSVSPAPAPQYGGSRPLARGHLTRLGGGGGGANSCSDSSSDRGSGSECNLSDLSVSSLNSSPDEGSSPEDGSTSPTSVPDDDAADDADEEEDGQVLVATAAAAMAAAGKPSRGALNSLGGERRSHRGSWVRESPPSLLLPPPPSLPSKLVGLSPPAIPPAATISLGKQTEGGDGGDHGEKGALGEAPPGEGQGGHHGRGSTKGRDAWGGLPGSQGAATNTAAPRLLDYLLTEHRSRGGGGRAPVTSAVASLHKT